MNHMHVERFQVHKQRNRRRVCLPSQLFSYVTAFLVFPKISGHDDMKHFLPVSELAGSGLASDARIPAYHLAGSVVLYSQSCCCYCFGLNTVSRAVSGNSRDGACFELDKQTWRRKNNSNNGTKKTISQNLLIKIL